MPEAWYTAYQERNKTLLDLGYPSYKDYLASTLWNSIRNRVLEWDRRSCWVCGFRANHVHHRLYSQEVLLGRCIDYLVAVCRDCHNQTEFAENQKLSLHDANNRLDALKAAVAERRRLSLTKQKSEVKVPHETPSVRSTRKLSKRQLRHLKRNQEQQAYLEGRRKMLAHKETIFAPKPIKASVERDSYIPPKQRPKQKRARKHITLVKINTCDRTTPLIATP